MYYGPKVVVDNLVFSFDAANDKCTDSDNDVSSMRDTGPIAHSSRSDRGMTAAGNTSAISITTTDGAETLDLGVTGRNSSVDATNYNNRMGLDDDILLTKQHGPMSSGQNQVRQQSIPSSVCVVGGQRALG